FHDPYLPDGMEQAIGAHRVKTLEELLRQSHVLSLHCPGNEETMNLIDAKAIDLLPDGSYLVNTARGSVVDAIAVLDALENGKLAGAALDVLPEEPPSPENPILQAWRNPQHPAHERLLLNPHGAWYCEEGKGDARVKASSNVRRVLLGEAPRNVVNGILARS
ncbi:MAG: NAD(P)-dependent oxidoreductase, partial [Opitutales bacterium]